MTTRKRRGFAISGIKVERLPRTYKKHQSNARLNNKQEMASPLARRRQQSSAASSMILKEGYLCKKGGVIKSWSRRYFVLNHQCLCYFKRALNGSEADSGLQPLGRVFLSDIVDIETEGVEKKRAFVFSLNTKKRGVLLQASNEDDREKWVYAVRQALEKDKRAEREDPFRRTLRKLKPGLKRVTLMKDPVKGIGCTIKSAAGHVLVNRIIEDGPIAKTGVLRPGDEILDIHGTTVTGMQVSEVVEVIKHAPNQFLATVRPLTSISKNRPVDTGSVLYSEIKPLSLTTMAPPTSKPPHRIPEILISGDSTTPAASFDSSPTPSLEDVGFYDDEEEWDTPPPIPPRTEDALVILDTPSQLDREEFKPALPPKPTGGSNTPPLSFSPARPPIPKSKSVEGIVAGRHAYEEVDLKRSPRPRRHHDYEEIQPALNYMDINKLDFSKRSGGGAGSKTDSLVKVEMDWKHKVHV